MVICFTHWGVLSRALISRAGLSANILMATSLMAFTGFKRAMCILEVVLLSLLSLLEVKGRVLRSLCRHKVIDSSLLLLAALMVSGTGV